MLKNLQSPISNKSAFTLVEISIVLVTIGLVVGGILFGKNMIETATIRSQISQLEKFNQAANTFKLKYGYLPGDLPIVEAEAFGFYRKTPVDTGCDAYISVGCGNGNGIIGLGVSTNDNNVQDGEPTLFWKDLELAQLIGGTFSTGSIWTTVLMVDRIPKAKLDNLYVYVWYAGVTRDLGNYFTISGINNNCSSSTQFGFPLYNCHTYRTMKVSHAYYIDSKIDDGLPQYGKVLAIYIGATTLACGSGSGVGGVWAGASSTGCWGNPTTAATSFSSTNCYDNNGVSGMAQQYSMKNNADANNCALSVSLK